MSEPLIKSTDPKFQDLTGRTFGRLTVIGWHDRVPSNPSESRWLCRCTCGKEKVVWGQSLRLGRTISCGCLAKERVAARSRTHGHAGGGKVSPTYCSWNCMMIRCEQATAPNYDAYRGAGIRICERWHKFENFLADMGERPSKRHTIDRIDNSKGYEPENCRWANWIQQATNRKSTRLYTHAGETLSLSGWARRIGITRMTMYARLKNGWSVEEALTTPPSMRRTKHE